MNTIQAQDLPMNQSSFEDRCEAYFVSEYKRRVDNFLSEISLFEKIALVLIGLGAELLILHS